MDETDKFEYNMQELAKIKPHVESIGLLEDKPDEELTDEEKQQKALDAAIKNIMERFACIVITQPLHVVTIRAMASFVGSEEEYNGILHGLVTTVKENG